MKQAVTLIALLAGIACSRDVAVVAVAIAATDLTNVNKSEYVVYSDVEDVDLSLEGVNLCELPKFVKHVDKFTCKKPVYYTQGDLDEADIVITMDGADSDKIVVCLENTSDCDIVVGNKLRINKENLAEKGYIPDPSRHW